MRLYDPPYNGPFWVAMIVTLAIMFAAGCLVGVILGVNPYVTGMLTAGARVLRATYQVARRSQR